MNPSAADQGKCGIHGIDLEAGNVSRTDNKSDPVNLVSSVMGNDACIK